MTTAMLTETLHALKDLEREYATGKVVLSVREAEELDAEIARVRREVAQVRFGR